MLLFVMLCFTQVAFPLFFFKLLLFTHFLSTTSFCTCYLSFFLFLFSIHVPILSDSCPKLTLVSLCTSYLLDLRDHWMQCWEEEESNFMGKAPEHTSAFYPPLDILRGRGKKECTKTIYGMKEWKNQK